MDGFILFQKEADATDSHGNLNGDSTENAGGCGDACLESGADTVQDNQKDVRTGGQAGYQVYQANAQDKVHGWLPCLCKDYGIGIHEIVVQIAHMLALGIDIGGSGIKGAIVDTETGNFVSERIRIPTPKPPKAEAVLDTLRTLIDQLGFKEGPVGVGFPGVIRHGTIETAANLEKCLIGLNLAEALADMGFNQVRVLNDADAAGFAEVELGAGRPCLEEGTVFVLTVGTGIGTALFVDGKLVPNLELGHIQFQRRHAESYLSERARKNEGISWKEWGIRFNGFLLYMEDLLRPDLIILGGGGVKKPENFQQYLETRTPLEFAKAGNRAGILGAALAACHAQRTES